MIINGTDVRSAGASRRSGHEEQGRQPGRGMVDSRVAGAFRHAKSHDNREVHHAIEP